jgi:23S rRNA (adenine2503-C2)-methyltransferase
MATELLGKSKNELREFCAGLDEPAYRGGQLYHALYRERKFDVAQITNLPAALRERLAREARITLPLVKQRFASMDGSVRYLFSLGIGEPRKEEFTVESAEKAGSEVASRTNPIAASLEAVFMPSPGRQTICVSTQAGCAVDCRFCLTAQLGLIRNLTAGEILAQVLLPLEEHKAALRILLDPQGMGISPKHVTLSTSGIVPGIERMGQESLRPKLAISLNASHDEQRSALMPINKKYPLAMLLEACKKYPLRPWEHLTFEYVMLGGVNDSPEDARRVVRLLTPLKSVKVNLIPWNPGELPYRESPPDAIEEFRRIVVDRGVPAFVRYSRGRDVMAACGQLALQQINSAPSSP